MTRGGTRCAPAADAANFSYGRGHPMQPHRARVAFNLMVNYGIMHHVQTIVRLGATPAHADGGAGGSLPALPPTRTYREPGSRF